METYLIFNQEKTYSELELSAAVLGQGAQRRDGIGGGDCTVIQHDKWLYHHVILIISLHSGKWVNTF